MEPISEERQKKLKEIGLHYCKYYQNVVRYNKPTCGKCAHATYHRR